MVRTNGKGKARISKPKRKTENATSSAATVATMSEPVKTNADAQALALVPTAEENKEEIKGEEVKEEEPKETTSQSMKKSKKRNRNRRKTKNGVENAVVKDAAKPENSDGDKGKKKAESMGMVFMCNSKTKKDCYQYKVLGLPASKKDMVAEIYKGMRLFLFDVDLKLMYGIYKAAGRGGYNLEPKAFKSAFPSQVRFTVLDDCLPLPEEKFKKVIKDNYYGKNKFNSQLNSEQVKNLCKLFLASNTKSKRAGRTSRRETRAVGERDRSRWPSEDDMRRSPLGRNLAYLEAPRMYEREVFPSPERSRSRWVGHDRHSPPLGVSSLYPDAPRMYEREALRLPERDRSGWRSLDGVRHSPLARSSLYLEASSGYEREAYPPPALPPPSRLPPPHPYASERPLDMDYYRRDALPEHHGHQVFDLEPRRRDITEYREGYSTYRQPSLADPVYSVAPAPRYQLVAPPSQPPLYRY